MNETEELAAFLSRLTDDVARLSFADWLEERFPVPSPVKLHEPPKGLLRWWHAQGHHRRTDIWRSGYGSGSARGWSSRDVMHALQNGTEGRRPNSNVVLPSFTWMDHGGASVVAGHPVVVGEPYATAEMALDAAEKMQRLLKCPVSCSRKAAWNSGCVRITVWFTFDAPSLFRDVDL